VAREIEAKGFGHLHASRYLHGVERLKTIRQLLFFRSFLHACEVTINPAGASFSLVGAAHQGFLSRFATAAGERGQRRVMAVQGLDGCDELPLQPVAVADFRDGELAEYTLDPADYGLAHRPHHPCESAEATAQVTEAVLQGHGAAHLDSVVYNAGVRLYLAGRAAAVGEGIERARDLIASGAAAARLAELRRFSTEQIDARAEAEASA
jgi:anthranilate phosphoribosyltransferase